MGKVIQFPSKVKNTETPTFKSFAMKVREGDMAGASSELALLFGCSNETAHKCCQSFSNFMQKEGPLGIQKTMNIREEITAGNTNNALALLMECFGLEIQEALPALEVIKKGLGK